MSHKSERHALILEVIGSTDVGSQEALRDILRTRGTTVTQATLSRDLRELGLVRVPGAEGPRYARPEVVAEDAIPSLETLLPQLFASVDGVSEMVVLHTLASGAQPVSEAIDAAGWEEVLGTIAGENTILIVCRSAAARQVVTRRLAALAASGS